MNISFLGEVVEIQEDGKLVVRDLTGAEMYEKEEDGSLKVMEKLASGSLYNVNLIYNGTGEIGGMYRVKGQFESQNNIIDVYHWTFFAEYYEELHG